jgi:hypothetical protein
MTLCQVVGLIWRAIAMAMDQRNLKIEWRAWRGIGPLKAKGEQQDKVEQQGAEQHERQTVGWRKDKGGGERILGVHLPIITN